MKRLIIIIIILFSIMALIMGCQPQNILKNYSESLTILEDFKSLKDCFIDYKFKIREKSDSFIIKGKYDINNDGKKDKINLVLQKHSDTRVETYMEVNGIKQEIYMSYTYDGEIHLVDLDENDNFIEIVFFDEGPSADPTYHIYRYDGNELYNIGYVCDKTLINGNGKIIPSGFLSNFEPVFYSNWLEIENNKLILKDKDIDEYLGKRYTLHEIENGVFFVPMEEIPEDFEPKWNDMGGFETTELTLIDIYFPYDSSNLLNFYFVELANGERGMLYFWVGD